MYGNFIYWYGRSTLYEVRVRVYDMSTGIAAAAPLPKSTVLLPPPPPPVPCCIVFFCILPSLCMHRSRSTVYRYICIYLHVPVDLLACERVHSIRTGTCRSRSTFVFIHSFKTIILTSQFVRIDSNTFIARLTHSSGCFLLNCSTAYL